MRREVEGVESSEEFTLAMSNKDQETEAEVAFPGEVTRIDGLAVPKTAALAV